MVLLKDDGVCTYASKESKKSLVRTYVVHKYSNYIFTVYLSFILLKDHGSSWQFQFTGLNPGIKLAQ